MWGRLGKCGGRWGKWVEDPIFPTSPLTSLTLQHTSPHLPHNSFHTSLHIFPLLPPHFLTPSIFPPYLTQLPKLPKIPLLPHHPYPPKFFITPILPHTPSPRTTIVTLSFTPHQNFSLSSFIVKLIQQSNTLETPCKFHKKNLNKKWQHSV